jgi:hypothetical protein
MHGPTCTFWANLKPFSLQTSTDGDGTTYRLSLTLSGNAKNVYTIYGDESSALAMPASYQEAAPFGANLGGKFMCTTLYY